MFRTTLLKTAKETFANVDMMPDMVDPLKRISFVRSANIIPEMKEAAGMFGAIAGNPRDPFIKKKTVHNGTK